MANSKQVTLIFSILLVLIFEATYVEPKVMICFHDVEVTIINDLATQSTPTNLTLHCKSKDDDLGFHTLTIGEKYTFSFKPSYVFWKSTLFFCSFTWPGNPDRHYIEVYKQRRDGCENREWKMIKTGGYLWGQFYPWNSVEINSISKM
ncbi:putative plant self-incompatibility S1 [Medicago truncatula]|uniref:S-protein homolog n=1 Tax=Medicago truncatula TaxID=3880 RepID=G7L4A3_MEDTR|nr:leguminosin group486 secreted peptide [Medicago truncatula]RHN45050.1 putative plant self-incompatibility S1 [Medicago truncatula]